MIEPLSISDLISIKRVRKEDQISKEGKSPLMHHCKQDACFIYIERKVKSRNRNCVMVN